MEFASQEDRDYYVNEDEAHKRFKEWALGRGICRGGYGGGF